MVVAEEMINNRKVREKRGKGKVNERGKF